MNSQTRRKLNGTTAPAPHVNRRMVDSTRVRAPVRHMTLPYHEIASTHLVEGETINALVKRTGWAARINKHWAFRLPTICVLNGKPVLQKAWRRVRLRADDVLEFWSKPMGGQNGKSILGLVATIALAVVAPWAGGIVAGALGFSSALATGIFTGLITIGGALLISALTTPKPGGQNDPQLAAIDPIYSVSASGNTEALLQPIPVQYGRVKSFPNFAITPWSEYAGNDQFLNVLLSVGLGKHSYETLYIDDTILWDSTNGVSANFDNVQVDFYDPNATVTLFPVNVSQSTEVSGQTITTDFLGGFVANASGSTATALAVDMTFPSGCFNINTDNGNLLSNSVEVKAEARAVDAAGAPAGDWFSLFDKTYTFATRSPQRVTEKITVAEGRYEVRVWRTEPESSGTSGSNSIIWSGLRAFINGPSSFPVSTVAIRIKANDQLSQNSAKKFGVLCTRMLPVWNGSSFVTQATRNPAWAFYDAATDTTYGAGRPPSKVDFQGVFDLATAADTRADTFDFRFSTATSAPEAFDTILKVTRARHRWSGDMLSVVRDEWSDTPRMLLTDREIVRGSLSLDYSLNTDDSADAVIVEYLDENTWAPAEVQYPVNSQTFTATQPSRIRLDGVVNRAQAHREAAFYYLCSQLRRVAVTLDTEHDGRMLGFGSRIRVQTELPQSWGYAGAVTAFDGTRTLTLDPAPTWTAGATHYIAIRDKTGRQFGPVAIARGTADNIGVLDATDLASVETAQSTTVADALARKDGADEPSFDFGPGTSRARDCVVISGRPNTDKVTLKLLVDNKDVHDTDPGDVPITPSAFALRDPKAPLIAGLSAVFTQGMIEPRLYVSWFPAAGAVYYNAQVSYDSGASWTPVYQGSESSCTVMVDYAALRVRVQGVGQRNGAWSQVDVSAPTIQMIDGIVALQSLKAGIQGYIKSLEDRVKAVETNIQEAALLASEQDAHNLLDKAAERGTLQTRTDEFRQGIADANASVTQVSQTVADNEAAFASYQTTVTAQFQTNTASITQNATAIAQVGDRLAASYVVTLDVDGYATGFKAYNDGSSSAFIVSTDFFQIAAPGVAGGDPKAVFTVGTIGGKAAIGIRGDMMLDGTVTANALNVGTLTAITANLGNATVSGTLSSRSSGPRMVLDFTNNQMVFYDG